VEKTLNKTEKKTWLRSSVVLVHNESEQILD